MAYDIQLLKKELVAEGTMAFSFSKPADFTFKAGQSIDLTLVNPPETDTEGNLRAFSLSAAPYENILTITTRLRDTAFKRVLKELAEGSPLTVDGPFGSMTLHNDTNKSAVFLVGGIGVTPFYSMIKQATHDHLPHKIIMFYSNRRPEDTAYLTQLQQLATENSNFTFIPTMTAMDASTMSWNGEQGYITKEMVSKYVPDMANVIGYMAGPAAMVKAMREVFNSLGLNDDYIRSEEFTGY